MTTTKSPKAGERTHDLTVSISERKLSDQSSVYSVLIKADGQAVEIECIEQKAAVFLRDEICRAIENYTNLGETVGGWDTTA